MRAFAIMAAVASALVSVSAQSADDPLMKQAQATFAPIPLTPPAMKGIASTPAMVELGKALYFDPRLSQSHNISCNTCHQIGLGGVDMLPTSIGHKWQHGGRNAPTVLNAVFNVAQFWDGRAADLKAQAGGPIQNPIEMGITHEHAVQMLKGIPGYGPLFEAAFTSESDRITISNVATQGIQLLTCSAVQVVTRGWLDRGPTSNRVPSRNAPTPLLGCRCLKS